MAKSSKINRDLARLLKISEKQLDKNLSAYEKRIAGEYALALRDVRAKIAEVFERFGPGLNFAAMAKYNRLANLEKEITERLQKMGIKIKSHIRQGIKDAYSKTFYTTAFSLESAIQAKLGFGLLSKDIIEAAVLNPMDRIGWPKRLQNQVSQMNDALKSVLTQGFIQGYSFTEIARNVRDKIERDAYQAIRIIRTEGQRAQSAARIAAFEKAEAAADRQGFSTFRVWVATLDNRTRDSHQYLDGQRADKDGFFYFQSGERTEGPGLSGIASEDINCRCTVIMEFEDIPQQVRQDNIDKEIIPYQTFGEWFGQRIA